MLDPSANVLAVIVPDILELAILPSILVASDFISSCPPSVEPS